MKCECGCGRPTPLAKENNAPRGLVKGQPQRFIYGHRNRGQRPHNKKMLACMVSADGCWLCVTPLSTQRAGHLRVDVQGRPHSLHRLIYEAIHGPLGKDVVVRHRCNHPTCLNPSHLLAGTTQDNTADRVAADRTAKGEHNGSAAARIGSMSHKRGYQTVTTVDLSTGPVQITVCLEPL